MTNLILASMSLRVLRFILHPLEKDKGRGNLMVVLLRDCLGTSGCFITFAMTFLAMTKRGVMCVTNHMEGNLDLLIR
jgi:hypothetical protein